MELHDSELVGLRAEGSALVVRLEAYVHEWEHIDGVWQGTGWSRPCDLIIHGSSTDAVVPVPIAVSDGTLCVGPDEYNNLLPLPFHVSGFVGLRLDLTNGQSLALRGSGVELAQGSGESKMIERLPADMKPFD
jgi:hypothetical protein